MAAEVGLVLRAVEEEAGVLQRQRLQAAEEVVGEHQRLKEPEARAARVALLVLEEAVEGAVERQSLPKRARLAAVAVAVVAEAREAQPPRSSLAQEEPQEQLALAAAEVAAEHSYALPHFPASATPTTSPAPSSSPPSPQPALPSSRRGTSSPQQGPTPASVACPPQIAGQQSRCPSSVPPRPSRGEHHPCLRVLGWSEWPSR